MTVFIEKADDRIRIEAGPRMADLVNQIPGSRFKDGAWTAPLSWGTCLTARGIFGADLAVGPELTAWSHHHADRLRDTESAKAGAFTLPSERHLFGYQQAGASFLSIGQRALLADEQGTGKTIQTIAALRHADKAALPVLVVATNAMLFTWRDEMARWWPEASVAVATGTAAKRRKAIESGADVVIIGWAALRSHSRLAPYGSTRLTEKEKTPGDLNAVEWGAVVVDEAHRMKDPKAKQTRAAWAVMHQARYRFALTGTPIANTPEDIWSVMHGLAPEDWPARTKFIDRFCHAGLNVFGGLEVFGLNPRTSDEFHAILGPRFLRRTKAEVLPDLPAKTYSTRTVEMGSKQAKAYEQMAGEMIAALDSGVLFATDPLVRLGRLTQLAAAMPVVDDVGNVVQLAEPSCKVDALLDLLDEAPGEPLVVFAASRKLIELCATVLERKKISYVTITGLVSPEERAFNVRLFQDGERQVCLATCGAGGEGITLHRASRLVFLQRPWSYVAFQQACDRIHRMGQEAERVEIIDVVTANSVDSHIIECLVEKGSKAQEVLRDPGWIRAAL